MTENVCYSILKTATQQIIQSAGFEGANNNSIETLTDVLQKYVQALGSSVSAYAQLNGRTTGNAFDVLEALQEFSMEPKSLKSWLEEEGKSLTPCWSEKSDPGRLIQGVVSGGRPNFKDMIEYKYGQYDEYNIFDQEEEEEEEEDNIIPSSPNQPIPQNNNLPDYIPNYFPAFPATENQDENEIMQEATTSAAAAKAKAVAAAQAAVELQKQKELQDKQNKEKENFPILVKNRKKPIDNPFTHIIPFEDSSLSLSTSTTKQDAAEQGPPPISLVLIEEEKSSTANHIRKLSTSIEEAQAGEKAPETAMNDEEKYIVKRRKLDTETLSSAINDIKEETNQLDEKKDGIIQNNSNELFKTQTENAATPGNYLFNKDSGVFDQVILSISDPIVLSKLTTPNLHTDIALSNNYSTPLATPTTSHYGNDMFSSNKSMLQSLANGSNTLASNASKLKRLNQPIPTINTLSKHSVDINAIKTGDSKYIIKKKKMLAEKERLAQLERNREAARERGEFIEEMDLDGAPASLAPISVSVEEINGGSNGTLKLNGHSGNSSSNSFGSSSAINTSSTNKPTATAASAPIKIPSGPISLSSFMSATSPPPSSSHKEKSEKKEKKKKDKGSTKLMLNLSTLPVPNLEEATSAASNTSSPNTPKIRFKFKTPDQTRTNGHSSGSPSSAGAIQSIKISTSEKPKIPKPKSATATTISLSQYQQQQNKSTTPNNIPTTTPKIKLEQQSQTILSSPIPKPTNHQSQPEASTTAAVAPAAYTTSEEINCICENPTVDYGTFMIACDKCGVWFHGSCVGIAESDHVDQWYCKRCKRH